MLTFNLKKEWFDKIKSGEKTHEYREVKPYWVKRLDYIKSTLDRKLINGHFCWFVCGYAKKSDTDRYMGAIIKSITIINGKNTDLVIDKDVYDIEFELIREV